MRKIGKILLSAMLLASFWGCAAKVPQLKTEVRPAGEKESVYFAGDISFIGNAGNVKSSYKYLSQIIDEDESLRRRVYNIVKDSNPKNIEFVKDQYGELDSSKSMGDRNVTIVLAIDRERVSTTMVEGKHKGIAQISGQIIAMDYNTASIIAMTPVNVIFIDIFENNPTEEMKKDFLKKTFLDQFIPRFEAVLHTLIVKKSYNETIKVGQVIIGEKSLKRLNASGESHEDYKTKVAGTFASSIAEKLHVPLLPYAEDQAIGSMELAIADKTVRLTIPESTYEFILTIAGYRVSLSEPIGPQKVASFVTFANIKAVNKETEKVIVDSDFNGVASSKTLATMGLEDLDVWTSLFDSTKALADEFAENVYDPKSKWLQSATRKDQNKSEIKKQLEELSDVLENCK